MKEAHHGAAEPQQLPVPDVDLRKYHMRELEIALSVSGRHVLPDLPNNARVVLDVGCGAGQTLLALGGQRGLVRIGIDRDLPALGILRDVNDGAILIAAQGEAIPLAAATCDAVICRVAMPYMHISDALSEMARVLRPGGWLWLTLHPPRMVLQQLREDLAEQRLRGVLYRLFVLANGVLCNATGRQWRYPLNRSRQETFQTPDGMRRLLPRAGFEILGMEHNGAFVVTARRMPAPEQSPHHSRS